VLVHGLGCSHRYMRPLAEALAPHAEVSCPDLPGLGSARGPRRTDVGRLSSTLAGWLQATDRDGSVLVANSAGCQVVHDQAAHPRQLLGPVVLIGPNIDREHRSMLAQGWRLAATGLFESPSLTPVLLRDYLVCGPRRFVAAFTAMLADRPEDKTGALAVPTVVVRGQNDRIAPRRWAQELRAGLPDGRLVEVPAVGHALNWTAPRAVAQLVRGLLERQPG
jgi:pimeloyl-ACP methyl ester carboxylesterase